MKKILLLFGLIISSVGISQTYETNKYLISEIIASPPNNSAVFNDYFVPALAQDYEYAVDYGYEYFEFRGAPNTTIDSNVYFIAIDGDDEAVGDVQEVIDLSGLTFGSNGVLVIVGNITIPSGNLDSDGSTIPADTKITNPYTTTLANSGANVVTIEFTGTPVWVDEGGGKFELDKFSSVTKTPDIGYDGNFNDQSSTYMIVKAPNGNPKDELVDEDGAAADDNAGPNGVLDSDALSWTIYDSVSILDDDDIGGTGEYAYGDIIFVEKITDPSATLTYDTSRSPTVITLDEYPMYVARQGNSTGYTASKDGTDTNDDWMAGRLNSRSYPDWKLSGTAIDHLPISMANDNLILNSYGEINPTALQVITPPNYWNGTTDTDWDTTTNWSKGSAPTGSEDVIIHSGKTNYPIATSAVTVNSSTISSGATLIAQNTFTGNVTYSRYIGTTNWYLMGSPVIGQDEDDFADAAGLATGTGSNEGLGTYVTASDTWTYYDGTTSVNTLTNGQGNSIKVGTSGLANSGNISYTGTMLTDDLTPITLTITGNGFNLVANPYLSFINSATMLTTSTGSLDSQTIWVWNQATNMYDPKVTGDTYQIAPGQGFFVKSDGASGTLAINEAFQSHQSSDTFQKGDSKSEIHLTLTDGTNNRLAKLYYIDGTTTGFDNGFDGPMFTGVSNSFAIFTKAINSSGRDLGIQSLPNDNYEGMIVPVGVNARSGKEITFSATSLNLPDGIKVILEDRELNVFTNLEESDYKVTLEEAIDGVGRFFLHTSSKSALSVDDNLTLDNISIYKTNASTLRIVGLQQGKASVKLYNVLGKRIISSSFDTSGLKDIPLPNLAKGVYIVQLETGAGKLNKKIILE